MDISFWHGVYDWMADDSEEDGSLVVKATEWLGERDIF
jgi:hypothetical protein